MSPATIPVPDDLWNEEGDRVWIRFDLCETSSNAAYKAYTGEGLPVSFSEMGVDHLNELNVRLVWAKPAPNSLHDEFPWKLCAADDPGAVQFWEVS